MKFFEKITRRLVRSVSLVGMCVAAAGVFSAAADDSASPPAFEDYSGTWQIHSGGPIYANPLCVFQQGAHQITGTCKGPDSMGVGNGISMGSAFGFKWDAEGYTPKGGTGPMIFAGKRISETEITGTIQFQGKTAQFTASKKQ